MGSDDFKSFKNKLNGSTEWQASPCCNVGPVPIYSGQYAGSYAVNTAILDTDKCFEKYRILLEACETNSLNDGQDLINPNFDKYE